VAVGFASPRDGRLAEQSLNRTPLLLAAGLGALIAVAVVLAPPLQVGLAFLSTGVAILAFFNRRIALYLIIPALTLSPDISAFGVPARLEDFLMVPLTIGWLAKLCVFRERERTPLDRLLLAYLLVGVAATLWGGYLGTAHLFTADKYVSSSFHLFKRVEFVLLFFIMADTLRTPAEVQRCTYILMASMVGLSAFGLSQFLSNGYIAQGPQGSPGHEPGLASMLNVVLALALLPSARSSARLLLSAVILFSIAVLPLSLGRNFLVATMLVSLYVGLFQQRWVLAFLTAPWVIGLALYPGHVLQRLGTLAHLSSFTHEYGTQAVQGASVFYRLQAPETFSLLALGRSPILGFGPGSVPLGFIDSEFVIQIFYTGLVGLAIFLLLTTRLFGLTRRTLEVARDPIYVGLVRSFQLALASYMISSIFNASLSATRTGGPFFVIAGLIAVLYRSLTQSTGEASSGAPLSTQKLFPPPPRRLSLRWALR